MLIKDPLQRIPIKKALLHPWFKKENNEKSNFLAGPENSSSEIMNEDSSPLENMKKFNHM